MIRFERRLQRLEVRFTDFSGLVPHTRPWFDYWTAKVDRLNDGQDVEEKIPLEFFDALMAHVETNQAG